MESPKRTAQQARAAGPNIKKILLPLDLQKTAVPVAQISQAAALARHFHSEIPMLYRVEELT